MASLGSKRPGVVGKMRERVRIYSLVRTEDAIGGYSTAAPSPLPDPVYAYIVTLDAYEAKNYSQIDKRVTHVVWVRYNATYARGQTVVWGSRQFYVEGVIDRDNRKRFLELACVEGANP